MQRGTDVKRVEERQVRKLYRDDPPCDEKVEEKVNMPPPPPLPLLYGITEHWHM